MNKKKIIWSLISLAIAGLTVYTVVSQSKDFSMQHFAEFVAMSNKLYLAGALLCMMGFIWFEGVAVLCILRGLGYRRPAYRGMVYGGADVYFSAITPSASGGQPACAFFMMKDKIPGTVVTVTLLTNLIMYTVALLSLGLICIVFRFDIFLGFSTISKAFILVGIVVLVLLALVFFLLLKNGRILYGICDACLVFLKKLHILKNGDAIRKKLLATMDEYSTCAQLAHGKRSMLWQAFGWNICQRLSQFGVVFMVFMAHGEGVRCAWDAFLTQCFVALGSNCVPIPGSMGVADYLMINGFSGMMPENRAVMMELLSRSISFYGCIVVSILIVVAALVCEKPGARRKHEKTCDF